MTYLSTDDSAAPSFDGRVTDDGPSLPSLVSDYLRIDAAYASIDASNPALHPALRIGAAMESLRLTRAADALDKSARKAARRAKVRAFFTIA